MKKNPNEGGPEYHGHEPRPEEGEPDRRTIRGERYPKTCRDAKSPRELKAYLDSPEVAKERMIFTHDGKNVSGRMIWAKIEALIEKNRARQELTEADFDDIPDGEKGSWAEGLRDTVKRLFGKKEQL